ncbi:protein FAM216A isoform X2 [Pristis pectinata]|uniref:protein FAM216A isoform X2 n=1 Tax=Pristis pectinata TaxID=685728 RepID=UPI00223CE2B7|nr:protein FAM216A isoform X2 [Pristis pectinata]XP_051888255.1 protein FAM216A isoform X2 [Pristis pectinata]
MDSRKQVTFRERESVWQDLQEPSKTNKAGRTSGFQIPKIHDSAELVCPLMVKVAETKEWKTKEHRGMLQQLSLCPQLKTIHIPRSVENAPFLQHPGLKTGQKRYLFSIANIYSTDHMHRLMERQYLNMLQYRTKLGYITSHQSQKYSDYIRKQSQKETWRQNSNNSSTARSSVKESPTLQPGEPISLPMLRNSSQSYRLHSGALTMVKATKFRSK